MQPLPTIQESFSEEDRKIPTHVAIIMDGNRRWAKENRLPIASGHKKGI